jgi:hypothetical protein
MEAVGLNWGRKEEGGKGGFSFNELRLTKNKLK